jgi:hypothetical protein
LQNRAVVRRYFADGRAIAYWCIDRNRAKMFYAPQPTVNNRVAIYHLPKQELCLENYGCIAQMPLDIGVLLKLDCGYDCAHRSEQVLCAFQSFEPIIAHPALEYRGTVIKFP